MNKTIKRLWNNEEGQGLTEYALIIALVSVLLVGSLTALEVDIAAVFKKITDTI